MKVKVYVFMMFLMMQFLVFSMQQDYLIQAAQNLEESFDRYEKISNKDLWYLLFGFCINPTWSSAKRSVKSNLLQCHTELTFKAYKKADAQWQEAYFQKYGKNPVH